MLKILLDKKNLTRYNSHKRRNVESNLKKNKSLINIHNKGINKSIKGSKTPKYSYINYNFSNILNLEKNLTKKENLFKQNVSNKIELKKDVNKKIYNNISLLENKIIDNYNSLKYSNYNYYQAHKNSIKDLRNKKRQIFKNKEYNNSISILRNDIDEIENKIDNYNNLTDIYRRNYNDLNSRVIALKKECKILPEIIDNLEKENKKLTNLYIKMNSDIVKIKYKIFELDKYKKNIGLNLSKVNQLYK